MNIKKTLLIASAFSALLAVTGCEKTPSKTTYVETERGLIKYKYAYCELGILFNNDHDNMLDENSKPITCTGYIKLTDAEFNNYDS